MITKQKKMQLNTNPVIGSWYSIFAKMGSKLNKDKNRIHKSEDGDNTEGYESERPPQLYTATGGHRLNFEGLPFYYRWFAHLMDMVYAGKLKTSSTFSNPSDSNVAEATYLYPTRKMQEEMFYRLGYKKGKEGDYGLVSTAVKNTGKNIPIYQRNDDEIERSNLELLDGPIYYSPNADLFLKNDKYEGLEHAGSYPTRFYVDPKTLEMYMKSWDLNDYGDAGAKGGYLEGFFRFWHKPAARLLDKIGQPVVVTTGFRHMYNPAESSDIYSNRYKLTLNNILDWANTSSNLYSENVTKKQMVKDYVLPYVENKGITIRGDGSKEDPYRYYLPLEIIVAPKSTSVRRTDSKSLDIYRE